METAITGATVGSLVEKWRIDRSMVSGTPAVVDGIVYWGDVGGGGRIRAANLSDGSVLWETSFERGFTASAAVAPDDGCAAAADRRIVYLGDTGGTLHAVDAASGGVVWSTNVAEHPNTIVWSSPTVVGDLLVFGLGSSPNSATQDFRGDVLGVRRCDGSVVWRFDVTRHEGVDYSVGVSVWSSAAVDVERKMLYIGTGQSFGLPVSPLSDSLLALDYETGTYRWHQQFTANDYFNFETNPTGRDADVGAAPNLFTVNGRPAVGVGDKAGYYYAIDRETGQALWQTRLTPGVQLGGVMTVAAYHDGFIFATSNYWEINALIATNFLSDRNRVTVFSLRADTGEIAWQKELTYVAIGAVTYAGGLVYVSTTDATVHIFDATTGEEKSVIPVASATAGGVTVSDGFLLVPYGFAFFAGVNSGAAIPGGLAAFGLPPQ